MNIKRPMGAIGIGTTEVTALVDRVKPAKAKVNTSLEVTLHKRAKRFCLENDTNISALIEELLEKHLSENGY